MNNSSENMKKRVLVVDDDPTMRGLLAELLTAKGYQVDEAENGEEALPKTDAVVYDHIITDINMPLMDGLALLSELRARGVGSCVTVLSAYADMDNVVKAIKLGASDFIAKPIQSEEQILFTLKKVEERDQLQKDNILLRKEVEKKFTFTNIVAKSKGMLRIFEVISKIADYKTTVLITGESGTGKELIAKAIHYNSSRRKRPMVSINCGGIPETLLESELFGHVKGAFTDAYRSKKGLFEEADGGTLFLDEVGELPMALQVKMLRALQEEEIRPLGANKSIRVNVRIIAATAKNLKDEVSKHKFREDLFYRINVLSIEVPPLRERAEDIPLLVDHFIKKYNEKLALHIERAEGKYMERLLEYVWPGNVRELENVIERSMVLSEGNFLTIENLSSEFRHPHKSDKGILLESLSIKENQKVLEKHLIMQALEKTRGNRTRAASVLDISIPALLYKMKEYGIQ